ncbi:MAG: hypothetical protein ACRBK7_14550 [Acidimicrobiales bacterium]
MPRTFNTHVEAETGAELRGWGYRKVADAAALAALADQVVGERVTQSDIGVTWEWNGANWRPQSDYVDASGGVWEYRVDTNGALHRWFRGQPPIVLSGASGIDIVSSAVQVPQVDFSAYFLVLAPDYSTGASQGLGGQYITGTGDRAWSARIDFNGTVTMFASSDGATVTSQTTPTSIYGANGLDGRKVAVRLDFRHLGATLEVDVFAGPQVHSILGHTQAPPWAPLGTLAFAFANLHNAVVPFHIGSRFRVGTGVGDGRECLAGTVEAARITTGATVQARFPNPAAGETWTTTGTNLAAPVEFEDPAPSTGGSTAAIGSFVGDGIATTFTVTHNLDSTHPSSVSVIEDATLAYAPSLGPAVTIIDNNSLSVEFGTPPANLATYSWKVVA